MRICRRGRLGGVSVGGGQNLITSFNPISSAMTGSVSIVGEWVFLFRNQIPSPPQRREFRDAGWCGTSGRV